MASATSDVLQLWDPTGMSQLFGVSELTHVAESSWYWIENVEWKTVLFVLQRQYQKLPDIHEFSCFV